MEERTDTSLSWGDVLLAVLPGLFALGSELGLWHRWFRADPAWNNWMLLGLCAVLCGAGFVRARRFPTWSFPALGIVLALVSMWVSTSLPILAAPVFLMTMLGVLPAVVGWMLARRVGVLAGLVFVGSAFVIWEMIGDPEYALLLWTDSQALEKVVSVHPPLFFLIVVPVVVMRLQTVKAHIAGFLLPIAAAFVSAAALGSTVRPYASFVHAVVFDSLFVLLPLAIVVVLCTRLGRPQRLRPDCGNEYS